MNGIVADEYFRTVTLPAILQAILYARKRILAGRARTPAWPPTMRSYAVRIGNIRATRDAQTVSITVLRADMVGKVMARARGHRRRDRGREILVAKTDAGGLAPR